MQTLAVDCEAMNDWLEEDPFVPGDTFVWDDLLWEKFYTSANSFRGAKSGQLVFLEQNPWKRGSEWAPRVWENHERHQMPDGQECSGEIGHSVWWLVVDDPQIRGSKYIGQIIDGRFYQLR